MEKEKMPRNYKEGTKITKHIHMETKKEKIMKDKTYLMYKKEKIENKKSILLNLEQEVYRELKMLSARNNTTMSSIIRNCVYSHLMDIKVK